MTGSRLGAEHSDGAADAADPGTAILYLEATIREMRGRLEGNQRDAEVQLEALRAQSGAEMEQLRAQIRALRDRMQEERTSGEAKAEAVRAAAMIESSQLHATISALRAELESAAARRVGDLDRLTTEFASERAALQRHIVALRDLAAAK